IKSLKKKIVAHPFGQSLWRLGAATPPHVGSAHKAPWVGPPRSVSAVTGPTRSTAACPRQGRAGRGGASRRRAPQPQVYRQRRPRAQQVEPPRLDARGSLGWDSAAVRIPFPAPRLSGNRGGVRSEAPRSAGRMPPTQAESVIKNIIREIGQECAGHGEIVSETLAAFMVKAVVLDPSNGFNMDRTLMKSDVQKLVKVCVCRLLDSKNPSLDTIKMQVYFDMNYTSRGNIYLL
uniref:Cilia- and flagella-associated protein 206 n=3 Tax=Canis lupus familiaris TaxID=9615 RepID=A0A8P0P6J8_CANLF